MASLGPEIEKSVAADLPFRSAFFLQTELLLEITEAAKATSKIVCNIKLMEDCIKGDIEEVRFWLACGANINVRLKKDHMEMSPLQVAIYKGFLDLVRFLIANGADTNSVDGNGNGTLQNALLYQADYNPEITQQILDAKRIKLSDFSPIFSTDAIACLQQLKDTGTDLTAPDSFGYTILYYAAARCELAVVKWLVEQFPDLVNKKHHKTGITPLYLAASNGQIDTMECLLEHDAIVDEKGFDGRTPLLAAAFKGQTAAIVFLYDRGAKLKETDKGGRSALHLAARNGRIETVASLLKLGFDINYCKDLAGNTALHLAASRGQSETVALLLENGAIISEINTNGETPLMKAAAYCYDRDSEKTLEVLLEHLPKDSLLINAEDKTGLTAFLLAAQNGNIKAASLLKNNRATIDKRDTLGRTALLLAGSSGYTEMIDWLLKNGSKIAEKDYEGNSLLLTAARNGHTKTVKWLIENGYSKTNEENYHGETALDVAIQEGHAETEQLLLNLGCKSAIRHVI